MPEDDLTRLYRQYGPAIYARCRSLLGDAAEAEDATQETFVRVHRHLYRLPPGREALYWIHRVATNYCLNELRNRRQRPGAGDAADRHTGEPASPAPPVEQQLADRDLATRLIAGAHAKVQPVAWLYHIDGFDQEEVAGILGLSRRTVATRLAAFLTSARRFLSRSAS